MCTTSFMKNIFSLYMFFVSVGNYYCGDDNGVYLERLFWNDLLNLHFANNKNYFLLNKFTSI